MSEFASNQTFINEYIAFGVAEMHDCGVQIAKALPLPVVVYLKGELGAGKTTLVQGIAQFFGYKGIVSSPSYNLIHEYSNEPAMSIDLNAKANNKLAHLDLYRLNDPEELAMLGLADLLTDNSVVLIEWPEKGLGYLPVCDVEIHISTYLDTKTNKMGRKLQVMNYVSIENH